MRLLLKDNVPIYQIQTIKKERGFTKKICPNWHGLREEAQEETKISVEELAESAWY